MSQAEGKLLPNFEKYGGGDKTIPLTFIWQKCKEKNEFLSLKQKQNIIVSPVYNLWV